MDGEEDGDDRPSSQTWTVSNRKRRGRNARDETEPEPKRPEPEPHTPVPIDFTQRTRLIIKHEVLSKFEAARELDEATKEIMVDFALQSYQHLNERENDEASLSVKMEKGFRSLDRDVKMLVDRISSLEKAQNEVNKTGTDKITKIDERCRLLQEATIPSEAEKTFAEITKKVLPKKQSETTKPRVEQAVETKNRFIVLETEDNWKVQSEDDLKLAKKEIAKVFKGEKIRTQRIVKTGAGNISIEFDDKQNQDKAVQMLQRKTPIHMQLRNARDQLTHLAMRGVPTELTEKDIQAQLQENNEDFPIFNDPRNYTLKTGDRTLNRSTRTWKLSVPREDAVRMVRQKRLFLDIESVLIVLWAPGHKRCTTCFSTEHKANYPRKCQKLVCNMCAGFHMARDCTKINKVEDHKCYVCAFNKLNANHCATTRDCPILGKEAISEAKKATAALYGE